MSVLDGPPKAISANTGVAIGLVVLLIGGAVGAAWSAGQMHNRMSATEADIDDLTADQRTLGASLADQDRRMIRVEAKLDTLISDVAATRATVEELRRTMPPPNKRPP